MEPKTKGKLADLVARENVSNELLIPLHRLS